MTGESVDIGHGQAGVVQGGVDRAESEGLRADARVLRVLGCAYTDNRCSVAQRIGYHCGVVGSEPEELTSVAPKHLLDRFIVEPGFLGEILRDSLAVRPGR